MKISFREFLNLDKEEQVRLGTFNEDLSGQVKKKKMKELENLLKKYGFYFSFADSHADWKRENQNENNIRKLVDGIGEDALELYKMYGQKAGVMEMVKV